MLKLMPWEKETGNADDLEEKPILHESALHHREKASRRAAMATMVTARVMGRAVWEEKAAAGKVLEKAMREDPKEVREVEKTMAIKEHASNAEKLVTKPLSVDKSQQ